MKHRPRRTPRVLREALERAARDSVREAADRYPLPSVEALTDRAMELLVLGDGCKMNLERQRYLIKRMIALYREGAAFAQNEERRAARHKPLNHSIKSSLN